MSVPVKSIQRAGGNVLSEQEVTDNKWKRWFNVFKPVVQYNVCFVTLENSSEGQAVSTLSTYNSDPMWLIGC